MNLNDWYDKGITEEAYMSHLDKHRESFQHILHHFNVPEADIVFLQSKSNLRVIALAEVWCGHCMMDVPVMLNMMETANIPVRFLPRDEHLELMDQYVTDGKRYIPIFVFIDEAGNELGKWGPMTPKVKTYVEQLKVNVPAKDDPNYQTAFRVYADKIGETFRNDPNFWNDVYENIKKALP